MNFKVVVLSLLIGACLINQNIAARQMKKSSKISSRKNIGYQVKKNFWKPPMITTRIVGGYVTTIQEVGGFLVAMRYDGQFSCGGSLVTEWFVVSAAHCVDRKMKNINKITIEGGISSLFEEPIRVGVKKVMYPSTFNRKTFHNDVAILKLSKALTGKDIHTIQLCSHNLKDGDVTLVSGWGSNSSGNSHTNEVYSVELPIINKRQCAEMYLNHNAITSSMICAGVLGVKDSCQGDSGGPLVFEGELCGIVSFGIGCAKPDFPGVYTDVRYVYPFIQKALERL